MMLEGSLQALLLDCPHKNQLPTILIQGTPSHEEFLNHVPDICKNKVSWSLLIVNIF